MSSASRVSVPWTVLLVGGLALLAVGAGDLPEPAAERVAVTDDWRSRGRAGPASARRAHRRMTSSARCRRHRFRMSWSRSARRR